MNLQYYKLRLTSPIFVRIASYFPLSTIQQLFNQDNYFCDKNFDKELRVISKVLYDLLTYPFRYNGTSAM